MNSTNFKNKLQTLKRALHIKQELSVESFLSSSTNTSSNHHPTCPPPTHSRSFEEGNVFNWSHAGNISKRSVLLHKHNSSDSFGCPAITVIIRGCQAASRGAWSQRTFCVEASLASARPSPPSWACWKKKHEEMAEVNAELTGLGVQDFLLRQENNHLVANSTRD